MTDRIPFTSTDQKLVTVQPLFSLDLPRPRSPIQEALMEPFNAISGRILTLCPLEDQRGRWREEAIFDWYD